jgi:hypothetical protein
MLFDLTEAFAEIHDENKPEADRLIKSYELSCAIFLSTSASPQKLDENRTVLCVPKDIMRMARVGAADAIMASEIRRIARADFFLGTAKPALENQIELRSAPDYKLASGQQTGNSFNGIIELFERVKKNPDFLGLSSGIRQALAKNKFYTRAQSLFVKNGGLDVSRHLSELDGLIEASVRKSYCLARMIDLSVRHTHSRISHDGGGADDARRWLPLIEAKFIREDRRITEKSTVLGDYWRDLGHSAIWFWIDTVTGNKIAPPKLSAKNFVGRLRARRKAQTLERAFSRYNDVYNMVAGKDESYRSRLLNLKGHEYDSKYNLDYTINSLSYDQIDYLSEMGELTVDPKMFPDAPHNYTARAVLL